METKQTTSRQRLDALFQFLVYRAFTGELSPF